MCRLLPGVRVGAAELIAVVMEHGELVPINIHQLTPFRIFLVLRQVPPIVTAIDVQLYCLDGVEYTAKPKTSDGESDFDGRRF